MATRFWLLAQAGKQTDQSSDSSKYSSKSFVWTKIGLLLGLVFLTIPPYGEPQKATLCNGIRSEFTHTREGGRRGRVKNHLKVSLYFAIYFACSLTQSVSGASNIHFGVYFNCPKVVAKDILMHFYMTVLRARVVNTVRITENRLHPCPSSHKIIEL